MTYPPSLQPESDVEGGSSAVKEEREVDGIARCDRVAEERVERPPLVIVSRSVYGILGNKHSKVGTLLKLHIPKYPRQFHYSYWWRARLVGVFKRLELFITGSFRTRLDAY